MIVKAFVSGQIAQSIFEEDDRLFILNARDTDEIRDCTPYEYNLFFNSGAEIKVFENISNEELRKKLLKEKICFDALHGTIGGMDNNLSEATRLLSIQRAESLVKETGIFDFVKSRLFGNPVPKAADLKIAVKLSKGNDLQDISFVYSKLINNRDVPDKISNIFKKTIFKLSLVEDLVKINNIFIVAGIFAQLFLCITEKNRKELNRLVYDFSINPDIKKQVPLISQILTRMSEDLVEEYRLDKADLSFPGKIKLEENPQRFDIPGLIKKFQIIKTGKKHDKGGNKRDRKIRDKIESQIKRIVKEAGRGNDHLVERFSYQLVKFNLESSREDQVCKTLCNLTSSLVTIHRLDLAQEFVEYALLLNIDDVYPWDIKAEIYKSRGDYDSALRICNEAIMKFPDEVVPRTIKIEILKARGQYDEALNLCNDTIQQFPQEVVPRNVKIEILKARGQYDEALNLCNDTIQQFPQDVVPRAIKIEILKARGQYDEALTLCNDTIQQFPQNVVLRTIKIEILKARGLYDEALKFCYETMTAFPFNSVIKNIKLTILFLMGTLTESDFSILNKTPKTDDDFIEYHLLGMFYLKNYKYKEAINIFEYGLNNGNNYESRCYFFSALCVAKMRLNKYRETRDLLLNDEDNLKMIPLNRLLLVHSTAELGDTTEAKKIIRNFITEETHLNKLKTGLICRYELYIDSELPVRDIQYNIENLNQIIREEEEYLLLEREIYPLAA